MDKIRVPEKRLREILKKILLNNNLSVTDTENIVNCLIEADSCGVHSHGIFTFKSHLKKIQEKAYNLNPKFKIVRKGGAFSVIDADNSIGFLSATYCINTAIEGVKNAGIYAVFSFNSNTYGPAFYYPLLAAKKGLIGITFCNSPANMAPFGGKEKLFGTNPLSVVIPSKESSPIILDMATSKVAKSKINEAKLRGEKIPLGWALDEEGKETTDPIEAIKGFMLPMEGHKGYGLALIIDVLSGVLSGAKFLNNVGKFYLENNGSMGVGQTFIIIDPNQIYGENFYEVMDNYKKIIQDSEGILNNKVRVPGDGKLSKKDDSLKKGIEIDRKVYEFLQSEIEKVYKGE
ncbi:Ldh family oxidoreductase [Fusobacterium sp. MFO224]|uniref:Ldh family oxidoreductase n=1 Tax=Fusobacterium sp. MFO224 TaxID=3378070 RepID=UPI00385194A3